MGTMWSVSDIPDWCHVEGGIPFDPATPPTDEQLGLLQSKSPIVHVNKVCGPVESNKHFVMHLNGVGHECDGEGLMVPRSWCAVVQTSVQSFMDIP